MGEVLMISYDRLWIYLLKSDIKASALTKELGISSATLARMKRNEPVSLSVIDRICMELDCPIETVVEIKRPEEN